MHEYRVNFCYNKFMSLNFYNYVVGISKESTSPILFPNYQVYLFIIDLSPECHYA
jgi:hypothetical protein